MFIIFNSPFIYKVQTTALKCTYAQKSIHHWVVNEINLNKKIKYSNFSKPITQIVMQYKLNRNVRRWDNKGKNKALKLFTKHIGKNISKCTPGEKNKITKYAKIS